jgi:mRNA-degrading endonuclease RelE of RelBE toxin-antitoxin system
VAAALQIWSATFSRAFDALPSAMRAAVQSKVDDMGTRLEKFPHQRLQGRAEFKLRVGDYRVLYEFDLKLGRIYLHFVGNRRDIYKRS